MKYTILCMAWLLFLSVAFSNCKEKFECSPSNTVLIPQNMKDFFFFKEGTWWVYVNVKTGDYDSLWVWKHNFDIYRGEGGEGFGHLDKCYEQTLSAIKSEIVSDLMSYRISNMVLDERERFHFIIFWRDPSNGLGKDFNLFFTNGILEKIDPVRPVIITSLDSVIVQKNSYNSLIEIDASGFIYDNIRYRLYAKNIGLIKYIDRDSNQWELIRYNINQ